MPDYHVIFGKLFLSRKECAIEFFLFLLKEKAGYLELEKLVLIQEIYYRKKKLLYDILYEIPIRNSIEKLFFLLEHKSRRANDFELQIVKYFNSPEMKAGMLLLKIIRDPWHDFINGWSKIQNILNSIEESKRIDLEEEMLEYIFRSRTVVRQALQPNWIVIYLFNRIT